MKTFSKAYIYGITENSKVIYVGQTVTSIQNRFNQHIQSALNHKKNSQVIYKHLSRLGESKEEILNKIQVICLESLTDASTKEIDKREIYWIKKFDTFKHGYNSTIGGSGNPLNDWNNTKTIKKLNVLWNSNTAIRKFAKEEFDCDLKTITNVYRFVLNKTDEEIKQRESRLKRNVHQGRPICLYNLNGRPIREYASVNELAREFASNGINRPYKSIGANIRTATKSGSALYGYRFQYKGLPLIQKIKLKKLTKVIITNIKTKVQKVFNSLKAASEYLSCSVSNISLALRDGRIIMSKYYCTVMQTVGQ